MFWKNVTSIFRAEEQAKQETCKLAACYMPISCLAYSSSLKMEEICSSETTLRF
jgi:hypothetical protein